MKKYFKNNWKVIPRWFFSNIFILGFLILSLAIFALEDEPTNVILKNLDFILLGKAIGIPIVISFFSIPKYFLYRYCLNYFILIPKNN